MTGGEVPKKILSKVTALIRMRAPPEKPHSPVQVKLPKLLSFCAASLRNSPHQQAPIPIWTTYTNPTDN
jgi:hypothetical protein